MPGDTAIDFARSSITWLLPEQPSHGRFAIDASLTLPKGETFYLCKQVLAGNVYDEDQLFRDPPYEFSVAFSRNRFRIFRDALRGPAIEDSSGEVSGRFRELSVDVVHLPWLPAVPGGSGARLPTARVRLEGIELEFPLQHLNWRSDGKYQAETGPVLYAEAAPDALAGLRRAYVMFNRSDRIELLVDSPRATGAGRRWERRIRVDCEIQLLDVQG
jgi:hypothetical protein